MMLVAAMSWRNDSANDAKIRNMVDHFHFYIWTMEKVSYGKAKIGVGDIGDEEEIDDIL